MSHLRAIEINSMCSMNNSIDFHKWFKRSRKKKKEREIQKIKSILSNVHNILHFILRRFQKMRNTINFQIFTFIVILLLIVHG